MNGTVFSDMGVLIPPTHLDLTASPSLNLTATGFTNTLTIPGWDVSINHQPLIHRTVYDKLFDMKIIITHSISLYLSVSLY